MTNRVPALKAAISTLKSVENIRPDFADSDATWLSHKAVQHCRSLLERAVENLVREEDGLPHSNQSLLKDLRRMEVR